MFFNNGQLFFGRFTLQLPPQRILLTQKAGSAAGRLLFSDKPPETVEAQRRRRDSSGPSGRADMPGRPAESGGGTGGMGSSGGGGGMPGGMRGLPVGVVILLIVIFVLYNLFSGKGGPPAGTSGLGSTPQDYSQLPTDTPEEIIPSAAAPTGVSSASSTRVPARPPLKTQTTPGARGSGKTWTVMLYQDADDPILEQDIYMDLNEAEKVGSDQNVNVVVQIDRYAGAYQGDGDWTGARRYYLTKDDDLFHVHSKMVADLGEVSMADPQTLVDFATWAINTYPADKYALILSDHGMGWPGGLIDPQPSALRKVNTAFAQGINENMMYTNDIDQALGQIQQQTGLDRFELIGMDACLMSHLEVYSALAPHAHFVVNSQETEPALGWAYTAFLQALEQNPQMDGGELGKQIVSSYIEKDQRIQDSQARLDYLRQGSPLGGLFGRAADVNPAQLSQQIEQSVTMTAANMDLLPGLMRSVNQLAYTLQSENQSVVARARTYAQSYTSVFGKDVPPSYIDLGNFAQLLQQESSSSAVRSAAEAVVAEIKQVVIAEKHGPEKPGSTGISIYFPNSDLYQNSIAGAKSYTQIADRFVGESLWDDFLAFHYTQASFRMDSANAVVPGANTRVAAPGGGQIGVSPLSLSLTTADYNQPVTLQANLQGTNIGYVYLFVGYYDPNSKSILVADKDYLESPQTRQVGDLYYPMWSDNQSFRLKYTWTPSVFAISDGQQDVVALLQPERYGASAQEAVYTADGIYTDAASGEQRYARMYFSNGQMTRVFGYTGMQPTGAMSEIIPQTGDQITLVQTWLESDGSGGYKQVTENGKTLTFGSQMFTWKELYAASGTYVVGFVVSDLNGNEKQTLGTVHIR
jgi:hypothetical protein